MFKFTENTTEQELFDFVVKALAAQEYKSADSSGCRYRTMVNGKSCKCAAGHLIPNELYKESIEGSSWRGALRILTEIPPTHLGLISNLQHAHDYAATDVDGKFVLDGPFMESIHDRLKGVAERFDLDNSIVDQSFNSN